MSVMRDTPTIVGDRLVLRPIVVSDAEDAWQNVNDPEAIRLTGTHASFTFEQIERYAASRVEQDDRWDLAVTERDGGRYLGEVALMDWDEDNRSCGFRREGVLRDALWWDGQAYDAIMMSVLRSEWPTT